MWLPLTSHSESGVMLAIALGDLPHFTMFLCLFYYIANTNLVFSYESISWDVQDIDNRQGFLAGSPIQAVSMTALTSGLSGREQMQLQIQNKHWNRQTSEFLYEAKLFRCACLWEEEGNILDMTMGRIPHKENLVHEYRTHLIKIYLMVKHLQNHKHMFWKH